MRKLFIVIDVKKKKNDGTVTLEITGMFRSFFRVSSFSTIVSIDFVFTNIQRYRRTKKPSYFVLHYVDKCRVSSTARL